MSEYQYYEFQALDRPFDQREMAKLRAVSTRAVITTSRFVNHYEWGDLKANPSTWMERYFDAFLYLANWGTHELMLRFPRRVLDLETVRNYCCGEGASVQIKGDVVILRFVSEDEPGEDWDDGSGWLSSLISLRADIAAGDNRALYLAWLMCAERGEFDDDANKPPVPPGLDRLSAPLEAFAEFLRIDGDLIAVAAQHSPDADEAAFRKGLEDWLAALPAADKTEMLVRLATDDSPHARAELLRRFRAEQQAAGAGEIPDPRSVAGLLSAAENRAAARRRREAEQAARDRARREREDAERRAHFLDQLAAREVETWREVDTLIATRLANDYDRAVRLLADLRDLAARDGRTSETAARIQALRDQHARKWSFVDRVMEAGLL